MTNQTSHETTGVQRKMKCNRGTTLDQKERMRRRIVVFIWRMYPMAHLSSYGHNVLCAILIFK